MRTNAEFVMYVCSSKTKIILIGIRGWDENGWKKAEYGSHVHHFLIMCIWDVLNANANRTKNHYWRVQTNVRITNVCHRTWKKKLTVSEKPHANTVVWSYDMEENAKKCVERYCELANKKTEHLYKVSTPCLDGQHFNKEELESMGELSKECSQIDLKCLYLARIGRPDILWSVNKLVRSVTKWTRAWDRRLARLISNIQHTSDYRQSCHVGNTAKQCRLGLFQDSDFAGDLEDSKSTSGGTLCVFGSHTFVPISWMCKKQTAVSHSSTESEIISLDAGFRTDGISALDLWDLIVAVLGNTNHSNQARFVQHLTQFKNDPALSIGSIPRLRFC